MTTAHRRIIIPRKEWRRLFEASLCDSARWLNNRRGSELFEAITELPEYYPTRTEGTDPSSRANGTRFCSIGGRETGVIEFVRAVRSKPPIC